MRQKKTLTALTTMALALPGISQAADIDAAEVDYQFSFYQENDDRMMVRAHQTRVNVPLKQFNLRVDLVKDIVSGASPMFNMPGKNAGDAPVQVLSGASIKEQRDVANFNLSSTYQDWDVALSTGVSSENDYLSHSAAVELGHDFNQKNTRLNLGWGLSLDDVGQTGSTLAEKKRSSSYALGISQLLDAKSTLQMNVTYSQHKGYLSDPYKKVYIRSAGVQNDVRPDGRYQWAAQLGYSRHLSDKVALHVDYRYYRDDWQIKSHTLELSTPIQLGNQWQLRPSIRYYSQSNAYFYQAYFDQKRNDGYYSSDYRLAGFGAISPELKLEKQFNDNVSFNVSWRYYRSDANYKLGSNAEALVVPLSFNLFNLGLSVQF